MSIKQLVHPSQWSTSLTLDATDKTFTVSAADSIVINNIRTAYGGSVKMLIIKPPIESQPGSTFECIKVSGVNTTTGVCYTDSMTNEVKYLVASGAKVSFNLVADGDMEYYGTDCWTSNGYPRYYYKTLDGYSGSYALEQKSISGSGYSYQNISGLSNTDNLCYSVSYKLVSGTSGSVYFSWYDPSKSQNFYTDTNTTANWYTFDGALSLSGTFTYLSPVLWDVATGYNTNFDNIYLVQNLIVSGTFEHTHGWSTNNLTISTNATNKRSMTVALKGVATSDNGYVYQNISAVNGQWYTFTGYGKGSTTGHRFKIQIIGNNTSTIYYDSGWTDSTTYLKKSYTFRVITDTSISIRGISETNGETVYFDDWYLVPLISLSASTGEPTSLANSYGPGYCGDNNTGSVLIDGSDLYCIGIVSGTDLNPDRGAINFWYRPIYAYNEFFENAMLISGSGSNAKFIQCYYNYSDYKFYFEMYNGNQFISSGCNSIAQSFISGTWINVGLSYDNDYGMSFYLDGELVGSFDGTWNQQNLPTLMAIGCVSGSNSNRALGYIDDICFYTESISPDVFKIRYDEYHDTD